MRLATYNVENLFERVKALNLEDWADGEPILKDYFDLANLIERKSYDEAVRTSLLEIMRRHRGLATQGESKYIRLHEVRGRLLRRPVGKPPEISAAGRDSWVGWFELEKEPVKHITTQNIARVIGLLNADVVCTVEAEHRIALKRFNEEVLPAVNVKPYDHVMLIDGNDDRGIDVGIMARAGSPIGRIRSHVDDKDAIGTVFSRDCPEYEITTASGNTLLVLINHFKSKGYGDQTSSDAKRERQAKRVREIYDRRRNEGFDYIVVAGDLNDTPDRKPLVALMEPQSGLVDAMAHPKFTGDGRPGTYANGTKSQKIDYILLSPKLAQYVVAGGVERHGVWGGVNGDLFPHLETMKSANEAASDHAALWVDLNI